MSDSPASGQDALMATALALVAQVDALTALGAHLRIEAEHLPVDAALREQLARVATVVAGDCLDRTPADQRQAVASFIRTFCLQAIDLLEHPGRARGWTESDPRVLQNQGRGSAVIADILTGVDDVALRLTGPSCRFLDVGTGAGWIALRLLERFPSLEVVGLDVLPPALSLARTNADAAGLRCRFEIRDQDVRTLDERAVYDAAWLPGPFLSREVLLDAMRTTRRALRPDGIVTVGLYAGPPGDRGQAFADLRTVRSGGHAWAGADLIDELERAGFIDSREIARTWAAPLRLFVARRPAEPDDVRS
jgi:SAM-dependent methyltransferase